MGDWKAYKREMIAGLFIGAALYATMYLMCWAIACTAM